MAIEKWLASPTAIMRIVKLCILSSGPRRGEACDSSLAETLETLLPDLDDDVLDGITKLSIL